MASIINKHNKKILNTKTSTPSQKSCNCRIKEDCPLNNNCLTTNILYNAKVTTNEDGTGENYIGVTEGTFKQRFAQHKLSFKNKKYSNSTELSKYIWQLKDNKADYRAQWTIITAAQPYKNISKWCDLCTSEKLYIINGNNNNPLNKRSELISKCRHENKYYLMNNSITQTIDSNLRTASFILIIFYFYSILNPFTYFKINVIRNVIQLQSV